MDYVTASYDEILNNVLTKSSLTIYKARRYHEERNNHRIVELIDVARIEARVIKQTNLLLCLQRELHEAKSMAKL